VPVEDIAGLDGSLRVEPTANNQLKGVRWAEDYEIGKIWLGDVIPSKYKESR